MKEIKQKGRLFLKYHNVGPDGQGSNEFQSIEAILSIPLKDCPKNWEIIGVEWLEIEPCFWTLNGNKVETSCGEKISKEWFEKEVICPWCNRTIEKNQLRNSCEELSKITQKLSTAIYKNFENYLNEEKDFE